MNSHDASHLRWTFDTAAERYDREGLLACIRGLIERDFGGQISKRYLWEIRFARRREGA